MALLQRLGLVVLLMWVLRPQQGSVMVHDGKGQLLVRAATLPDPGGIAARQWSGYAPSQMLSWTP